VVLTTLSQTFSLVPYLVTIFNRIFLIQVSIPKLGIKELSFLFLKREIETTQEITEA